MSLVEISINAEPIFYVHNFPVTNSFLLSILLSFILIVFAFWQYKKGYRLIPSRLQSFLELVIDLFYSMVKDSVGEYTQLFFPWVMTFFIFIILGNWMGLIPGVGTIGFQQHILGDGEKFVPFLRGIDADLNTTLALALLSVALNQYFGLSQLGVKYLTKFFNFSSPLGFFIGILELISEIAKIISFAFRLFGNIFAGEVLLLVVGALIPVLARVPFLGLEVFVGFVQAFVFASLSLIFFHTAVQMAHEEEE